MSILTNLFSLLGDNSLATGIIPSMTFLLAILVVFDPIIKTSFVFQQQNNADFLILLGLLIVIPIVILSYLLIALNTYIIRIFSGHTFIHRLPIVRSLELKRAVKLATRREELKKHILDLERKKRKSAETNNQLSKLKDEYYSVSAEYEYSYPPLDAGIQPTQFGNIIRASEAYTGTHYGQDKFAFWPLLISVIPDKYRKEIDSARNELAILVNMSLLAFIFSLICLFAIAMNSSGSFLQNLNIPINLDGFEHVFRYALASVIAIYCSRFFNQAALHSVSSYAILIRSAFDLYRLDLLENLRIPLPKNSIEEFEIWKNLGELIVLGQESLDFVPLEYIHKGKS